MVWNWWQPHELADEYEVISVSASEEPSSIIRGNSGRWVMCRSGLFGCDLPWCNHSHPAA